MKNQPHVRGVMMKKEKESQVNGSPRIQVFGHYDSVRAKELTGEDGHIDLDIRFVELRLVICVMRCRTCNPRSSRWRNDYRKIEATLDFVTKYGNIDKDEYKWS